MWCNLDIFTKTKLLFEIIWQVETEENCSRNKLSLYTSGRRQEHMRPKMNSKPQFDKWSFQEHIMYLQEKILSGGETPVQNDRKSQIYSHHSSHRHTPPKTFCRKKYQNMNRVQCYTTLIMLKSVDYSWTDDEKHSNKRLKKITAKLTSNVKSAF